jgi:hypothetical protein
MFTLEIGGRPVAVLNLPTVADAEELLGDKEFRNDLTALQSEGRPLWDGQAAMSLREATADERAALWTSQIQMPQTALVSECHEAAVATYGGEYVDGRSSCACAKAVRGFASGLSMAATQPSGNPRSSSL